MNLRDALLAAPAHGTDRLSVDADRRLRRRLGLESTPARRAWLVPAFAACAVAAIAAIVIVKLRPSEQAQVAAMGFVDVSKTKWDGTITAEALEVRAGSATVTWHGAAITAAPETRLSSRSDGGLVLARGAIQIERTVATPQIVHVPQGRVVIASYRSSITVGAESVTLSIDDGSGQFIDEAGHTHSLRPGVPWISPTRSAAPGATAPVPSPTPSAPAPRPRERTTPRPLEPLPYKVEEPTPPGVTPRLPLRPDAPCTFKSDCDEGATCRKNEFGASVCMGNGAEGAACWFDTDCLSNSCVQRHCGP